MFFQQLSHLTPQQTNAAVNFPGIIPNSFVAVILASLTGLSLMRTWYWLYNDITSSHKQWADGGPHCVFEGKPNQVRHFTKMAVGRWAIRNYSGKLRNFQQMAWVPAKIVERKKHYKR